jgi:hypothetical protein
MTDLTQQVIQRNGHIEILTANQIRFNHGKDMVVLRGPLHAKILYVKKDGKNKLEEELVLKTPNDTRQLVNNESAGNEYDIVINDMGAMPAAPSILDLIVGQNHMDIITSGMLVAKHDKDMIKLRGPGRFRLEYKNDKGQVIRAEDLTLNTPNDIREFVNRKDNEDMYITGSYLAPPAPAPAPAAAPRPPTPAPAPVAAAAPGGAVPFPNGTLIKTANFPAVYIIENGKKRNILNPAVMTKYGYSWDAIKIIPDAQMNAIPTGEPKS